MQVKIKKVHPDAVIPKYALEGDAALDITCVDVDADEYGNVVYRTGLAFEIPPGYVGLLFSRSSIYKKDLVLSNGTGVLDSNFRGEVLFKFKELGERRYEVGDRIGQILILSYRKIEFVEVKELSASNRGESGFGSTGE